VLRWIWRFRRATRTVPFVSPFFTFFIIAFVYPFFTRGTVAFFMCTFAIQSAGTSRWQTSMVKTNESEPTISVTSGSTKIGKMCPIGRTSYLHSRGWRQLAQSKWLQNRSLLFLFLSSVRPRAKAGSEFQTDLSLSPCSAMPWYFKCRQCPLN